MAQASVRLAVLDFLVHGASPHLGDAVGEILRTELATEGDFEILERGQLGRIAKEHKLQLSGVVDPDTAVKLGRIVGSNYVIIGAVSNFGGTMVVTSRLVDVEKAISVSGFKSVAREGEAGLYPAVEALSLDILRHLGRSGSSRTEPAEASEDAVTGSLDTGDLLEKYRDELERSRTAVGQPTEKAGFAGEGPALVSAEVHTEKPGTTQDGKDILAASKHSRSDKEIIEHWSLCELFRAKSGRSGFSSHSDAGLVLNVTRKNGWFRETFAVSMKPYKLPKQYVTWGVTATVDECSGGQFGISVSSRQMNLIFVVESGYAAFYWDSKKTGDVKKIKGKKIKQVTFPLNVSIAHGTDSREYYGLINGRRVIEFRSGEIPNMPKGLPRCELVDLYVANVKKSPGVFSTRFSEMTFWGVPR